LTASFYPNIFLQFANNRTKARNSLTDATCVDISGPYSEGNAFNCRNYEGIKENMLNTRNVRTSASNYRCKSVEDNHCRFIEGRQFINNPINISGTQISLNKLWARESLNNVNCKDTINARCYNNTGKSA
jgi:hypothetical protein